MAHAHTAAGRHRGRLVAVLAIGAGVFIVELLGALFTNSLALLADAGHLLADLGGIAISLGAIWIAARPTRAHRSFGLYRLEILAAVINAVILFGIAGFVLIEALDRLADPPPVLGAQMLVVALVAVLANGVSLRLLHDAQRESLTVRGAYVEVLGDLAGSAAVVVAALLIATTGFREADPIASILVGLMILPRTWALLREAVDILLEASPRGVDMDHVRQHILDAPGVEDVHDLHAWTITSGMNVVSAHVVLAPGADPHRALDELSRCLADDFDIEHSTFQLETHDRRRLEESHHD